jgi:hypothetical protein
MRLKKSYSAVRVATFTIILALALVVGSLATTFCLQQQPYFGPHHQPAPLLVSIPVNEFLPDGHWAYNMNPNHPGGQRNEFRNYGGSFRQYRRGL